MDKYFIELSKVSRRPLIDAGNNLQRAIKFAKTIALDEKCSVYIRRRIPNDDFTIAIIEYPNYLKNQQLDERDLYVNRIERY